MEKSEKFEKFEKENAESQKNVLWTMHQLFDKSHAKLLYGKFSLPLYFLTKEKEEKKKVFREQSYLNIWIAKEDNRKFDEGVTLREEEYISHPFHENLKRQEISLIKKDIPLILSESLFNLSTVNYDKVKELPLEDQ